MKEYAGQTRILVAVDCIIFGFDGEDFKLLLIQRALEPEKGKWSLMGGFVQPKESLDEAAKRILEQLTGLKKVYLEQMHVFGAPERDPLERTIAVTYFALINLQHYQEKLHEEYHAKWFSLKNKPPLIFDHEQMVEMAKNRIRYKAALHPILFELLGEKFTLPQLLALYEDLYDTQFDKRNFTRKVLSSGLLIKLDEKDKENSRKGAFYYKLDQQKYQEGFQEFLNLVPNPARFIH